MQSVVALQRAAASASMSIVQSRTSLAKVATDLLSGLQATALTGAPWPLSTTDRSMSFGSQTRAVLSSEPVRIAFPSGLQATAVTAAW